MAECGSVFLHELHLQMSSTQSFLAVQNNSGKHCEHVGRDLAIIRHRRLQYPF